MARVIFEGKRLDDTTRDRLVWARKVSGLALVITQGGYNAGGVAASAGTHDAGGVIDIRTRGLSLEDKKRAVLVLRQAGFVAWLRTVAQGFDVEHIHAVELASTTLSPAAQRQIDAWRKGRNGLASGRPDDGPKVDIPTAMPGTTSNPAPTEEDDMKDDERQWLIDVHTWAKDNDRRTVTLQRALEEALPLIRLTAKAVPTLLRQIGYLMPAAEKHADALASLQADVTQALAEAQRSGNAEQVAALEQILAIAKGATS